MNKAKTGFLVMMVCSFSSCVMTKTYTEEERKMKVGDEKVLVFMKNESKVVGEKLNFPTGKKGKETIGKLDGREIDFREIAAYQYKDAYYTRFGNDKNYTWVKQLKRGKINLYYYDESSRTSYFTGQNYASDRVTSTHFIFQKGQGQLLELSIGSIADMLKNNKEAYTRFTQQFGNADRRVLPKQLQNHPKVLFEAIDIYNGT